MRSQPKRIAVVCVGVIIAALWFLKSYEFPGHTFVWRELGNAGHFPLFAVIATAALLLSLSLSGSRFTNHLVHYWLALAVALIFGFASELVQLFGPRDADIVDLVRDGLGAFAALSLAATFDPEIRTSRSWINLRRRSIRWAVLTLLVLNLLPTAVWWTASIYRDRAFPQLTDFDSRLAGMYLKVEHATLTPFSLDPVDANDAEILTARITFFPAKYPGFTIREPLADWTSYQRLIVPVHVRLDSTVNLTISVTDSEHDQEFSDRFTGTYELLTGYNRIEIDLAEIAQAPVDRTLDLRNIRSVRFFVNKPQKPVELYFENIYLE